jgi:hypothetical protein
MPSLSLVNRRDPWWEADGPAARRARRRRHAMGLAAFAAAMGAVSATAFAWSIQLGLAAALGIHAALPFG